jgi:hypothetical protein
MRTAKLFSNFLFFLFMDYRIYFTEQTPSAVYVESAACVRNVPLFFIESGCLLPFSKQPLHWAIELISFDCFNRTRHEVYLDHHPHHSRHHHHHNHQQPLRPVPLDIKDASGFPILVLVSSHHLFRSNYTGKTVVPSLQLICSISVGAGRCLQLY